MRYNFLESLIKQLQAAYPQRASSLTKRLKDQDTLLSDSRIKNFSVYGSNRIRSNIDIADMLDRVILDEASLLPKNRGISEDNLHTASIYGEYALLENKINHLFNNYPEQATSLFFGGQTRQGEKLFLSGLGGTNTSQNTLGESFFNRTLLYPNTPDVFGSLSNTLLHEFTHMYRKNASRLGLNVPSYAEESAELKDVLTANFINQGFKLNRNNEKYIEYLIDPEEIHAREWALAFGEPGYGKPMFESSYSSIASAVREGSISELDEKLLLSIRKLGTETEGRLLPKRDLINRTFLSEPDYLLPNTSLAKKYGYGSSFAFSGINSGLKLNGIFKKFQTFNKGLKLFGSGGKLKKGSVGIVGERGPELFSIDDDGASIIPLEKLGLNLENTFGKVPGYFAGTNPIKNKIYKKIANPTLAVDFDAEDFVKKLSDADAKAFLETIQSLSPDLSRGQAGLPPAQPPPPPPPPSGKTSGTGRRGYTNVGATTTQTAQQKRDALRTANFTSIYEPLVQKNPANAQLLANIYGTQSGMVSGPAYPEVSPLNLTKFKRTADVAKNIDQLAIEFKNAAGAVVELKLAINKKTGKIMMANKDTPLETPYYVSKDAEAKAGARRKSREQDALQERADRNAEVEKIWDSVLAPGEKRKLSQEVMTRLGAPIDSKKSRFYEPRVDQYGTKTIAASFVSLTGEHLKFSAVIDEQGRIVVDSTGKILKSADAYRQLDKAVTGELEQEQRLASFKAQTEAYMLKDPKVFKRVAAIDPRFMTDSSRSLSVTEDAKKYRTYNFGFKDEFGTLQKAVLVADNFGNVIDKTNRRMLNFTDSLRRNMGEFFKWTLALSIIYMPMQKLQELYTKMIENQTRLAQTIVTLGVSQEATTKIFEDAAKIAEATGTSVEGVLEGYNLAFRATGNMTDQTEKFNVANKLMYDSITLSKLGLVSQAEATDILVAALKQSGMGLSDGAILLDKWVTVSRNANVDVTTLATSFAIVGEAASNAGLDVDELNGIIATVAEKTITSAKETGNAVRALVSGYSTEGSARELQKFGIAVTDTEGKARGMMDVFRDIQQAVESGIMSKTQLNELALTIGGGNRRQAQAVLSIMGIEQSGNVAGISRDYEKGASQRALDIMVDTVQGKLNRVTVEFTRLAQVLGTEGGVLGTVEGLIEVFSLFAKVFTGVASTIGNAATVLMGLGIGKLALAGGQFGAGLGKAVGGIGGGLVTAANYIGSTPFRMSGGAGVFTKEERIEISKQSAREAGQAFSGGAQEFMVRWAPAVGGLIGVAFTAALRAGEGDLKGAGQVAAGGLIGALAGAGVGAIFPAAAPWAISIGALLGSTIGETIANATDKAVARTNMALQGGLTNTVEGKAPRQYANITELISAQVENKSVREYKPELAVASLGGTSGFEAASGERRSEAGRYLGEEIDRILKEYNKWLETNFEENNRLAIDQKEIAQAILETPTVGGKQTLQFGKYKTSFTPFLQKEEMNRAEIEARDRSLMSGNVPGFSGLAIPTPKILDLPKAGLKATLKYLGLDTEKDALGGEVTEFQKAINSFGQANQELYKSIFEEQTQRIKEEYESGDISAREVKVARESARASSTYVSGMAAPFKFDPTKVGKNTTKEMVELLTDINIRGSDDEKAMLTQLSSELKDRYNNIEKAIGDTIKVGDETINLDDYKTKTAELLEDYLEMIINTGTEIVNRTPISPEMDFSKEGYSKDTIKKIFEDTKQSIVTQADSMTAAGEPEQAQAFLNANKKSEFWVIYKDGTRELYKGVLPDQMQEQIATAKSSGALKSTNLTNWGITKSQYENQFESTYKQIENEIKAVNPEFDFKEEDMLVYTKDNQLIEISHKDSRVINETLKRIEELEQKQLDGVFNLPEGASFYIPFQAAQMHRGTEKATPSSSSVGTMKQFKEWEYKTQDLVQTSDSVFHSMITKFKDWEQYIQTVMRNDTKKFDEPSYVSGYTEGPPVTMQTFKEWEYSTQNPSEGLEGIIRNFFLDKIKSLMGSEYFKNLYKLFDFNDLTSLNQTPLSNSDFSSAAQRAISNTTTQKLDFNINNQVQLVVNGRVLAEVIKPYLVTSLIQYGNSVSSTVSTIGNVI